jgi:hypothetical protein
MRRDLQDKLGRDRLTSPGPGRGVLLGKHLPAFFQDAQRLSQWQNRSARYEIRRIGQIQFRNIGWPVVEDWFRLTG